MSKRHDILSTAEGLFYSQGFHATGIDQIVREAGVTPRTLYRHFPSKEHLVLDVLHQREARLEQRLEACLGSRSDAPPLDWGGLFDELESWFAEEGDKGCLFLHALAEYSHKGDEITRSVLAHKQRWLEFLGHRLSKSLPTDYRDTSESLMLIMEGAVALAPVIGGAPAARRARMLAARLLADLPITPP